jgi:hypothetical protein
MKAFIIHLSKIQSSIETAVKAKEQLDKFNIESELFEGSYGDETQTLFKSQGRKCYPWGVKGPSRLYSEEEKENVELLITSQKYNL